MFVDLNSLLLDVFQKDLGHIIAQKPQQLASDDQTHLTTHRLHDLSQFNSDVASPHHHCVLRELF